MMGKLKRCFSFGLLTTLLLSTAVLAGDKRIKLTTSSEEARDLFWQARKALENQDVASPPQLLQKAIELDPEFAFGYMLLSAFNNNAGHMEKALELAKNASEAERKYIEATQHARNQSLDDAIAGFEEVLKDYPNDRMTNMMVGQLYAGQSRWKDAERVFAKSLKLDGSSLRVYQMLGNAYAQQSKSKKAEEVYQRAVKLDESQFAGYQMLSNFYAQQGRFDEANDVLKKAGMATKGNEAQIAQGLGTNALFQDDYSKARKHYRTAVSLTDRDATPFIPFFGLAWTYLYENDGQIDPALEIIDDYMGRYNRNGGAQGFPPVWIWNHTARIKLENGHAEEALKDYETGYKSVPGSQLTDDQKRVWEQRSHHGKARALAKLGKFDEAWGIAESMRKLLETEATDAQKQQFYPPYHYLAGYILLEKKEYKKAVEHLEQAVPNDPFHQLLLGRAYEKSGDLSKARERYEAVTKMTNNNIERALAYPEAKKRLAMLSSN